MLSSENYQSLSSRVFQHPPPSFILYWRGIIINLEEPAVCIRGIKGLVANHDLVALNSRNGGAIPLEEMNETGGKH